MRSATPSHILTRGVCNYLHALAPLLDVQLWSLLLDEFRFTVGGDVTVELRKKKASLVESVSIGALARLQRETVP